MKKKEVIVYTSGTWDLFHIGHLNILEKSAALGDKLIVGVSSDELIYEYKGIKPVIPFEQRMRIVESIGVVSQVVRQDILTDIRQLKEFDVDIVTIGDDWKNKYLEGLEWMKSQSGKKVVYLPYTGGISTTSIKKIIIDNANEIIQASLDRELKNWTGRKQEE
ncbi:MAG: adenylyltransferase/cytidyltransferase family protein [Odoribacter sp.]|nr:adenylyltransferase/cytidyltransferase family protein [Odoribacter sp.]